MSDATVMWFRSKVDWWLGVLVLLPPVLSFTALAASLMSGRTGPILAAGAICVLVVALYALFVVPVRYGIGSDELTVRSGVTRKRIPLDAIAEVTATRNPQSSPGFSLDRLEVRTHAGGLPAAIISPADRDVFLDSLAVGSGLTREGDRLVRATDSSAV